MATMAKALPWVSPEQCEGCADCVSVCPARGLRMIEVADGVFVPWLDDPDLCTGCGRCEAACTWGAISMTSYVELARERFLTRRPGAAPAASTACGWPGRQATP
jgi:NAD-dependent dihydropyrimidine dehydrogenase PreA subunit